MPIKFISLNEEFTQKIKLYGFEAYTMKIEEYIPDKIKQTYYVSPANSLCFMDGGIDYALSRIIFPEIEKEIKNILKQIGKKNLLGRNYLPIGSSVIIDKNDNKSIVISPTMLLPQNVSNTKNAYYCTMSVLYNLLINQQKNMNEIDIIFTSFCCGYGKMSNDESIRQIIKGIDEYMYYNPIIYNNNIIINEPNLKEQPKYYQNTEFLEIDVKDIITC